MRWWPGATPATGKGWMDYSDAISTLGTMLASDAEPVLDDEELARILKAGERVDPAGNSPLNLASAAAYAVSTAYTVGDVVKDGSTGRYWMASSSGTSASVAFPDLSAVPLTSNTVDDGSVLWTDNGTSWRPTYNLHAAAAFGWRAKAAKVASRFDFTADGATFNRRQHFANCMEMASAYDRKPPTTVTITAR